MWKKGDLDSALVLVKWMKKNNCSFRKRPTGQIAVNMIEELYVKDMGVTRFRGVTLKSKWNQIRAWCVHFCVYVCKYVYFCLCVCVVSVTNFEIVKSFIVLFLISSVRSVSPIDKFLFKKNQLWVKSSCVL